MADLKDLISQASSNQSGTTGKASLLDYADKPQEVEAGQEGIGQDPMLSQQDVQEMSRQGAVSAVEQQIDPGVGGLSERDRQAVTESGIDPELIFESNAEKAGKSLVAGTGIVVSDIGNMIDYAAMTILPDELRKSDTFLKVTERLPSFHKWGESLQKWGEVHQSPGLDEFTLDDMFKMEFWATDVAKTLPYMASMIIPGKAGVNVATGLMKAGARSAAKKGMFGSAKRLVKTRSAQETAKAAAKGSSKAVAGAEAALGGEGLMGALATVTGEGAVGLSAMGSGVASFLGAGTATTAVIGAGLAGDVYNKALGMGLSEDQAQEAAHGTFVDNSKWFALNGLSWGIQFGGLSGKAFKQFNKLRGGAESAKQIQKNFGQRLMQHAKRGTITGTFEGTEEMFQETYEEWIQQKNLAEVQGKEFVEYSDFLTSDENRKTLGVSFAAGFLMGGRGGFMNSVAENGRRITNKRVSIDNDINMYENMSEAQKKVRTNEIIEAAIREDQIDGLNGMLDKLQKADKISAEERAEYDNTILEYSKIASTLPFKEKLTEVGQQTLFNIKVKEYQSKKSLENLNVLKQRSIAEANENLEGEALTNELAKIENDHSTNVAALESSIAEGKTAVAKLLSAKKYTASAKSIDSKRLNDIKSFEQSEEYSAMSEPEKADLSVEKAALEERIKEDSYEIQEANEAAEGLTQEEYEQFTKKGEVEKAERQKQEAESKVDKVSEKVEEAGKEAEEAGKSIFSKAKSFTGRAVDFVKQKFADVKKRQEFRKAMRPFDAEIQELQKEGKTTQEIADIIKSKIDSENISDEDLSLYINTVTGATQEDVESETETAAEEDTEIVEDEDTTTEEDTGSAEETEQKEAQSSDKKPEPEVKEDSDITYAQRVKSAADKIAKKLSKKVSKASKSKMAKSVQNLFKEGFGTIPGGSKKMKTADGVVDSTKPSVLQYYSSINPALESTIVAAASRKFPNKQLLILREVIDEHGGLVAGMALGSAVHVTSGSDVGMQIMHEYGHVYYQMMKDNPSFIRGVSKIIKSKVFRDIKNSYSEELLYSTPDANGETQVLTGNEIIQNFIAQKESLPQELQEKINAMLVAHDLGDAETTKAIFDEFMNTLVEDKVISLLPDNQQDNIIEEAFVTSLAPQMASKLNVLFDKGPDVVQYEGFIKRLKGRISKLITPKDAKEILSNVDRKFENLSLEEIGNTIIDDIASGVDGAKFKTGKTKYMKYGLLSKELSAVVEEEANKLFEQEEDPSKNATRDTNINSIADAAMENIKDKSVEAQVREEAEYIYSVMMNRVRHGLDLNPDSTKIPGVERIYKSAGYNVGSQDQNGDTINEDNFSDEISDEYQEGLGEQDVNVMSDDYQKQLALDNSSSHLMKAVLMIANPVGKNKQFTLSRLESEIHNLAFAHRDNVLGFIKAIDASGNSHVSKLNEILKENTEPGERLTILREFHNNYRNKFQENISITAIKSNGNISESEAIASSERRKINGIVNSANKVFFKSKDATVRKDVAKRIQAAKDKLSKGQNLTMPEALKIMVPILYMSDRSQYLNMDVLSNIRVSVGNKQLGLPALVESWIQSKTFNTYFPKGKISVTSTEFKNLVEGMVVGSRSKNAIKTVSNVEGMSTAVVNNNSHLLNQAQYITDQARTAEGRESLLKEYPGNPLIKMVVALGAQGLEQEAFKLTIDGGTVSFAGVKSKTVSFQNKTKEDIFFGDLEKFINSHDGGKPEGSKTYYTQPISIFSNSKRRYSIQMPMITTDKQRAAAEKELKARGLDKIKYKDGENVLGLARLNEEIDKVKKMISENPGVLEDNPVLSKVAEIKGSEVVITKAGEEIISDYVFNFALNSVYAQELFIGSHQEAKTESDYIKRATGAIARHDGSLRGVAIEPIIFNDIKVDGIESTDAASFILPEDLNFIQNKVGSRMGHLFKFVYYGSDKRGEAGNQVLNENDFGDLEKAIIYLKTAVHVLTPEMIGDSEVLQNIADKLEARRNKNGYGESLNLAVFKSGAKKFPNVHGTESSIDHDTEFGEDSQAQKDLDAAYVVGNKLVGIDGANMGIQLPMDNGKTKTTYPTQLVGANNNDLTEEQSEEMDQIQALEAEVFEDNLQGAVGAMIADQKESTVESRLKVKQMLGRVVGNNAITSTSNGAAKLLAAANDKISQNLPGLHKYFADAIKSLIKKSAKIVTNGNIAIQATGVGKNLKAYTKGVKYNAQGESRNVTLPAEAVVPASFKGKYLARIDKDANGKSFNTKEAIDNYISSTLVKKPVIASSKVGNISPAKIAGLDRSFGSELEARDFLSSKIARLEDGTFVILGEEFIGSRIPAHGNQSRVVMEIKAFQTEVKSKSGKFQNNSIQIPTAVNGVLGSDHDGDSIFMNFKNESPKTSAELKVNEYIDKTISFYQKENKFEEITADLEINDEIEARKAAVEKRFPSTTQRSNQNSPVGAAEYFEENVSGSGMVGNVAALNNGMSYLSRYGVGLGFSISINGVAKRSFNNDWSGNYSQNSLAFQGAKTLQIVLDNAKNQQATTLGLNPATIVAGSILPRIGFNASQVDLILNSKAAKLYAKHAGKKALRDRNFSYTSAAESALKELIGEDMAESVVKDLNTNPESPIDINTDLIVDGDIRAMDNEISIIKLLHKLDGVGQDVYMLNNLLGQHKTVPSNAQEAREMSEDIDNLLSGESSISGDTALKALSNNPIIKSFNNRLKTTIDIYSKNQISGTTHADKTFDLIKSMTGGNDLFKSIKGDQAKIINDYILNIITNFSPKVSQALGKHATSSKTGSINVDATMAQLDRMQREALASEQNNEFLNAVVIRKQEGFKDAPDKYYLSLNRDYINEATRPFEIELIKKDFSKLDPKTQEMFLAADTVLNGGGLTNSSISLLFDDNTLISISKSIDSKHQEILKGIDGSIADAELVADTIIVENSDLVQTAERFYVKDGKKVARNKSLRRINGSSENVKLVKVTADIQKSALRTNSPHYIKIQDGETSMVYKWISAPASKFDPKNWESTSKKHGKYKLVGTSQKGAPTRISNLKKAQRASQARTALIDGMKKNPVISKSSKMKLNTTKSGSGQRFSEKYSPFTFQEYLEDKGYTDKEVEGNPTLKESLEKLYKQYRVNFNLAQEFDRSIVQTGKLKTLSEDRLTDYALLFQKLDPSAISKAHSDTVIEIARRASESQKASRNGIEWTDKGDISWLHAWFGSNNIAGHRPEIQKLVRTMEKEYGKFMDENIKFQKELDRLNKNLIRDNIGEGNKFVELISKASIWFAGGGNKKMNDLLYGNMYDVVETNIGGNKVSEMKLKSMSDFLKTKPNKSEIEFYNFFRATTSKYGDITSKALGERVKDGYIPHMKMGLTGSIKQRGLFGLYDYMLQGTGDINHVRVKGVNPMTGKSEILPFHQWKYLYYTSKGAKGGFKKLFDSQQYRSAAKLDVIRKRAEKLAKSGKHEDGKKISMTEQEVHGTMGTNLMSRFTKSRGVSTAMFGSNDLAMALSQYVNTSLFTYGNENFKGFKSMIPLLDGVIEYNKKKGNKNAVTYLENVWKRGFYTFKDSQLGLGRLGDNALHQLVKLTRIRYLSLGFSGGFGNLMIGKYNEFRSKGGKNFARGEARYWGQRKKAWAIIKNNLNPERFAYDLIKGNDSSGIDTIMMSPYIGSEHYIQGSGFVSQFTEEEWSRIGEDGIIPEDLQEKADLYVDNVTRQQGYGYSKVDQIGIATYSWGKALMQFKKWMPTSIAERFGKETIDRFGEMRSGSNREAFSLGSDFARQLMAGEESVADFRKRFKALPEHKKEAVKTFFRGMQVVSALTALSMMFGDSDDDELRSLAKLASDTRDDIMFMTDPRRIKYAAEPASWGIVESGATMAVGIATIDREKFRGGLTGISWTAAQVLDRSEKSLE